MNVCFLDGAMRLVALSLNSHILTRVGCGHQINAVILLREGVITRVFSISLHGAVA